LSDPAGLLTESVVREFGGKVRFVVENYGDSEIARRFGVTRYPAIFVNDVLVAKPKDFGFYGKGEGGDNGRYTPWKDAQNHERFRSDLRKMIELVLAGKNIPSPEQSKTDQTQSADEITALPTLQISDLSSHKIDPRDLADRAVVVEFWATWCPPCRGTLAWLGKLKQQYGDKLAVLSIAIESEEKDVKQIASNMNLPFYWMMGSPETAKQFGDISSVPTLFVFDKNGKTAKIFYGAPADLHQNAETAITQALK
jgi:thiol-disulfide isomerase/thioredoxin